MKNRINLLAFAFLALTFSACSSDDDRPEEVNEEEVITTVSVRLANSAGITTTLASVDLDGDGPNPPVVTISGPLTANTSYTGTVGFFNDAESPAENITLEVEEEDDEHQVFFTIAGLPNTTAAYANFDGDNNPLGTMFTLQTGEAGSGNVTITLRHEPTKPNTGLADAGGETDIEVTFAVDVE